jgi:hypothetical protein
MINTALVGGLWVVLVPNLFVQPADDALFCSDIVSSFRKQPLMGCSYMTMATNTKAVKEAGFREGTL